MLSLESTQENPLIEVDTRTKSELLEDLRGYNIEWSEGVLACRSVQAVQKFIQSTLGVKIDASSDQTGNQLEKVAGYEPRII